jgi:uncharacterized protein (DUF58 family)
VDTLRPPRTIRPTREGWWVLGASVGLGFAAMNTGNNLLYLLVSMLLGLIVVSGLLSERSIRGVRVALDPPEEVFAGHPAFFAGTVANGKRWAASYSIVLEIPASDGSVRSVFVPRLAAGEEQVFTWEATYPRRGREALPPVRITTRFPFGLFAKAARAESAGDLIVCPAVRTLSAHLLTDHAPGEEVAPRRGRGADLYNLREYHEGDDPRLIHWRSSAKTGALVVRELEAENTADIRLVLCRTGAGEPQRLEAGLSEAASLAVSLLRAGAKVELAGPGVHVALGGGRRHEREVLHALALYDPGDRIGSGGATGSPGLAREVRVDLG